MDLPAAQQEMHHDFEADIIKGEYIIKFKNQFGGNISESAALQTDQLRDQIFTLFNIHSDSVLSEYRYAFKGFAAKLSKERAEALRKDPRIARVTSNVRLKITSPGFKKLHKGKNTMLSQTTPWGVNRVGGPLNGTGKSAWILDTGIDLDHPDLNVDVPNSVSFIATESADDGNGHGSHVAGIIAAINNSVDVVGVAAGATVVAVKVCHNNYQLGCPTNDIIDGVDYVASHAQPLDIVNMSLGGYTTNTDIDDAVTAAANSGIRFSIAAGNSALNASDFTPARVNHPNVWTVSAFRQGDEFAQVFDWNTPNCNPNQSSYVGSNYGNPPVDYSGPGENILSLYRNGGTFTTCGTSMAAPHIAGLLLVNGNNIYTDGTVSNDSDSNPDEIAVGRIPAPHITASVSNNRPKLDWNSVSGAQSYKIYRKFETGNWSLIATVSSTSFTDINIVNPNLQVISSPPWNYDDFYSYKVHTVPTSGSTSTPSNYRYFSYTGCTKPGCGS